MHLKVNSDLLFHCQVSNQQGKLEEEEKKKTEFVKVFLHTLPFFEFPSRSLPELEAEHHWSVRNKYLQITDTQSSLYRGWCQ